MKKMLLYALAIIFICFSDMLPFAGTDVAKLHPVEVLIVRRESELLSISTDSGLTGFGADIPQALSDLKVAAPGEILLETANYVLLAPECADVLDMLFAYLRPACQVYYFEGTGELAEVAKYLQSHPSDATLLTCKRGETEIPTLIVQGEVYRIAEQ